MTDVNNVLSIGHSITFNSKVLGEEKEIYISLPPQYDEHIQSYPVIFTLEAEFLFDPTRTIAHTMASRSKMPESIIIGIPNGVFENRHEFSYERWNGKPDLYASFFKDELIPYLEKNYRVNDFRTIIGLSPSTGFLFESFMRNPGVFQNYIAICAHLEWDRVLGTNVLDEVLAKNDEPNYPKTTFFMARAASDFPIFDGAQREYNRAEQVLTSYVPNRVVLKAKVFEDDEHYLVALSGIKEGFKTIYPHEVWHNPGTPRFDENYDYAKLLFKDYYDELTDKYGFNVFPVETAHGYGYSLTGILSRAKKWGTPQQVKNLALLGVSYFPNSAHLRMELARVYVAEGATDNARKEAKHALELANKYGAEGIESYEQLVNELN